MFPELDHPHALLVADWSHLSGGVGVGVGAGVGPVSGSTSASAASRSQQDDRLDDWFDEDESEVCIAFFTLVIKPHSNSASLSFI
jgi:hypothetical protein